MKKLLAPSVLAVVLLTGCAPSVTSVAPVPSDPACQSITGRSEDAVVIDVAGDDSIEHIVQAAKVAREQNDDVTPLVITTGECVVVALSTLALADNNLATQLSYLRKLEDVSGVKLTLALSSFYGDQDALPMRWISSATAKESDTVAIFDHLDEMSALPDELQTLTYWSIPGYTGVLFTGLAGTDGGDNDFARIILGLRVLAPLGQGDRVYGHTTVQLFGIKRVVVFFNFEDRDSAITDQDAANVAAAVRLLDGFGNAATYQLRFAEESVGIYTSWCEMEPEASEADKKLFAAVSALVELPEGSAPGVCF